MLRRFLFAAMLAAAAGLAHAQNASNGQTLYTTPVVAGRLSCENSACHGTLPNGAQSRIANGANAAVIKDAISSVSRMNFLAGQLTDAQLNDLAAYIAGKLGVSPTYIAVSAAPSPSVSPSSLSFASGNLRNTSAAQTITVSNASSATAALVLGAISTTSGGDFAVTGGSCAVGASLAAGRSCTIAVSFTPTVAGTRSSTLTVAHNGSGGASVVSLTGTGVDNSPAISVSPTQLTFSQTQGSSSDPLRVTVSNSGTAALQFSSISLQGANASEFSIGNSSTCSTGASLASGASCYVELRFTPAATGSRVATLSLVHNANPSTTTVSLSGQGNATPQPGFALDATALDLGAQGLNTTGTARTLTVLNNGQADLVLSALSVSGAQANDFVLGGSCAVNSPVVAGAKCTVTVALRPSALGVRSATLNLATNAAIGTATVALSGSGVATPEPVLTLSQPALGFGMVTLGTSSAARTVTLSNSGSADLLISSIQSSSGEFRVTHSCPASLAPGESCVLSVVYSPASANAAEVVVISSNAYTSPNSIVLTGLGVDTALSVLAWQGGETSLNFAATEVGKVLQGSTLTLVNEGPDSVVVSAIGTAGANADAFSIGGGTCLGGITLAAKGSCTVVVSFVPDVVGLRSAVLLVASNGSNPADITLSGNGVAGNTGGGGTTPPADPGANPGTGTGTGTIPATLGTLAVAPAALDFRAITVKAGGQSEPLIVRISNTSATSATFTAVTTTGGYVVSPAHSADACPGVPWTLAVGASCTVQVVFSPAKGGTTSGSLTVVSASGQTLDVPLIAQAETVDGGTGGGSVDVLWLGLLALVLLLPWRSPRSPVDGGA